MAGSPVLSQCSVPTGARAPEDRNTHRTVNGHLTGLFTCDTG